MTAVLESQKVRPPSVDFEKKNGVLVVVSRLFLFFWKCCFLFPDILVVVIQPSLAPKEALVAAGVDINIDSLQPTQDGKAPLELVGTVSRCSSSG
jgi:hypothetical protein